MTTAADPYLRTYCNPLTIPDYPAGLCNADKEKDTKFLRRKKDDYREMADPSVLYHDGKWYLYPSGSMAYVSEDFQHWRYHDIGLRQVGYGKMTTPLDVGYAPTIMEHADRFYITGCGDVIHHADNPLGPFELMGKVLDHEGKPMRWLDPMMFSDDDGRVYAYWGCGAPGIFGAECDPTQVNKLITPGKLLFGFDPSHEWERNGDNNENPYVSMTEGAWMLKHGGRYYLTFSAPGTRFRSYAMGVYVSDSPLGPCHYAARNPILRDPHGFVHGPGHGCIVSGPNDTLWAFYTCVVRSEHAWERRVGVDPAGFDENGNLFVRGASEIPQWVPGVKANPHQNNDADLLPLSVNRYAVASSEAPGRDAYYVIDDAIHTWWEPAIDDAAPWVEVDLNWGTKAQYAVAASRILWKEPGLDYGAGRKPGPVGFLLEALVGKGPWQTLIDARDNATDLLIDYRTFPLQRADKVRLTITRRPQGINTGVLELTMFGRAVGA